MDAVYPWGLQLNKVKNDTFILNNQYIEKYEYQTLSKSINNKSNRTAQWISWCLDYLNKYDNNFTINTKYRVVLQ